jgi:DNA mismatch repair protein MutL
LNKVAVLDPLVAQQVAAGEVVDRPASVVKELSENALDAGATRIEVEIADGGRERMLVKDDGSGMTEEDAKLSVLRHATSKIRTASDIESVMTMGFRGEALPSIASVCAFSLTTSTGEGAGTNVIADGGGEVTVSAASHPKGTTVLVDRLFYNVPARRAFLKSARAERAAIVEVITNLAIAHPQVMFRLVEQGRQVLSLPAAKDLIERLAQLYGVGKARAMRPVDHESGPSRFQGTRRCRASPRGVARARRSP